MSYRALSGTSSRLLVIALGLVCAGWAQTIGNCPVFPANNVWNTPIDGLPVHPQSSAYVNTIGTMSVGHADFGSGLWAGAPIGIPFITVPGSQTKVQLTFQYSDESDPGPYPVPPNAPIEGGSGSSGDRHVLVIDQDNCILYELYSAYPQSNGSWTAGSGAVFDLKANNLRPATWTSADAAGLPMFPGLARYDEVAAGAIQHALRFTAPQTQKAFIWPARHYASSITDSSYPPMGVRFRLKAPYDISGFSPDTQVILRALKKYGMILADNGSSWYVSGAPDPRWNNNDLSEFRQLQGTDFEAVDESSLIVDPNSAQAAQGSGPPQNQPGPNLVSLTPTSGSGASQTFAATYSDAGGGASVALAYILVNSGIVTTSSCFIEYSAAGNTYRILNDAGNSWSSPVSVGSGSASNSQCTISGTGAGATPSGNNLTVNFPITFAAGYAGAKNVFLLAVDGGNQSSGWLQLGSWTVTSGGGGGGLPPGAIPVCNAQGFPCVASLTPTNGSGLSGTFTGIFTHSGGASQHYLGYILFLPTPNIVWYTATGSCLVEYNRISNAMRLINDAGTNWLPGILGIPLSQGGSLANSHCTLDVTHSSAQINGTMMTVTVAVTFNPGFTGQLATFMQGFDVTGAYTGMTQFGNWMAAPGAQKPGPYVVSLSPTSGAGSSTTLSFTAGHTSGVSSLSFVTMLISSVIVGGAPCQAFYFPGSNTINLINDAGTAFVSTNGITPGTAGSLANGRCSIDTGGASRVIIGNNATVSLPMTFIPGTFGGMKNVSVNAFDNSGLLTHWVRSGTWTVQ